MAEIDVGHGAASHDAADEVDNGVCNKQWPVGVSEMARIRNIGDLHVVSAGHVGKTLRLGGRHHIVVLTPGNQGWDRDLLIVNAARVLFRVVGQEECRAQYSCPVGQHPQVMQVKAELCSTVIFGDIID